MSLLPEQDLIIVSEVNGTPSDVTKNIQVKSIIDLAGTAILTGMINNFASQGSGGYDYMEWTSNVTPDTQIPLFKVPCDMQLQKVGWIWCGAATFDYYRYRQYNYKYWSNT